MKIQNIVKKDNINKIYKDKNNINWIVNNPVDDDITLLQLIINADSGVMTTSYDITDYYTLGTILKMDFKEL